MQCSRGDGVSWEVTADEMIADVVAEYSGACTQSRRVGAEARVWSVP